MPDPNMKTYSSVCFKMHCRYTCSVAIAQVDQMLKIQLQLLDPLASQPWSISPLMINTYMYTNDSIHDPSQALGKEGYVALNLSGTIAQA